MIDQSISNRKALLNKLLKGKKVSDLGLINDTIKKTNIKEAPLSYAQGRMWFLHQLNEDNDAYNMHSVLKLTGSLNTEAIKYSLLKIFERHEALRTNFYVNEDGQPMQIVRDEWDQTIDIVDLSNNEIIDIEKVILEELKKPFDLENDLLIRPKLFKVSHDIYYMVVVMHHIISDGWSFSILSNELMSYYNKYLNGDYSVEELDIQYIDYTLWQREEFAKKKYDSQLNYWKKKLSNLPEPLDFNIRKGKSSNDIKDSNLAKKHKFNLSREKLQKIKSLSKENNVTLYMTLLTSYIILLNKYCCKEDIVVGTPVANRRKRIIENLIGFFVNTLPIRVKLNGNPSFSNILQEVKKSTLEAFSNQDIPFEYIVQELKGNRTSDQTPIFQTMFVLQNTRNEKVVLPNLTVEAYNMDNYTAKFDLLLSAIELDEGLEMSFEYKVDLFSDEIIESMVEKLLSIIDDIIEDGDRCLDSIADNEQVIYNSDDLFNHVEEFSATNIVERFNEMSLLYKDKIALSYKDETITYDELNKRSNQLSRYIDKYNIKEGSFVGVCIDRSIEMIIIILAVLKSNLAYVPLDPDSPRDRLDFIVRDADIKLIIGSEENFNTFRKNSDVVSIDINKIQDEISKESAEDKATRIDKNDNAYMIYTSGSTGLPKGVIVSHYNVIRLFSHTDNLFKFSSEDVWTMFHSFAFDFSVWEIWGALLYGGELIIVPYKISRTPNEFLKLFVDKGVTVLNQTPSAFRQLLQYDEVYDKSIVDKVKLKYIIFGGEALDFSMLRKWVDAYGDEGPKLINMYGITETTVHVTYEVLDKEMVYKSRQSLIGQPIKDLSIYILDNRLRKVPRGVVGEMYVGGGGVTKGYWNRQELNEERFIKNPFTDSEDLLYKTGDLACRHINGDLEYIGRNDDQVKVKGFRIELNEIKEQINENDLVKDNLVIVDKWEEEERIISYVILDRNRKDEILEELMETDDYDLETEEVFNYNYSKENSTKDDLFNIIGWNNTYTNEQMSEAEMKEWLNSICNKINGLSMKSVLEIGIGTGMILHKVAPKVDSYTGIDISKEAIKYVEDVIERNNLDYKNVRLLHSSAFDVASKLNAKFDTVILNSVIQYFPDVKYLEKVLMEMINLIDNNGQIIIGDVRDYDSLELFYLSHEIFNLNTKDSVGTIKANINASREKEKELALSNRYFRELQKKIPEIACVEMTAKSGEINNELSKYRYDVILTIDKSSTDKLSVDISDQVEILDWDSQKLDVSKLKDHITKSNAEIIHISNILNERTEYEYRFAKLLDVTDEYVTIENLIKLINKNIEGLKYKEIEEIGNLCSSKGFKIYVSSDNINKLGYFDIVLYKDNLNKKDIINYLNNKYSYDPKIEYSTNPLKFKLQYKVSKEIKQYLIDRLPYYMIPNEFVLIDKIPININGKVDYKKLPKPSTEFDLIDDVSNISENRIIQEVTKIWQKLLNIDDITVRDNFFELGGHSLLATNLIFTLNDLFDVRIPLKFLFEQPTIKGISGYVYSKLKNDDEYIISPHLDLDKDVKLPIDFNIPQNLNHNFENIMITGATGFFGALLLHRIMIDTNAKVYCLVRATNNKHAYERIIKTLKDYKVYDESYESRIIAICGDLSKDNLGICDQDYEKCSKEVDLIIHNGAKVNFFEPYRLLKPHNVDSIVEIVKLAVKDKIKPIHFISTLYVYEPDENENIERIVKEDEKLTTYSRLRMGYTQSKWVAEKILELAKNKGLPVNVYRLGRISGHSKLGCCQQKDFLWSLVKGCIEIGKYPDREILFEFTPVDYLTDAVVKVVLSKELDTNYHIFNKHKTSLQKIAESISKFSYEMEKVDFDDWILAITTVENSARHLAQLLIDNTFDGGYISFENDNIIRHAPHFKGIEISSSMLDAVCRYFIEIGYFPQPNMKEVAVSEDS